LQHVCEQQVSQMYSVYGVPLLIAPSAGIFYCCLCHRSAVVVSRILAILNAYECNFVILFVKHM